MTDLSEMPVLVAAMFPDGSAIAIDIRGEEGDQPIIEIIRSRLDARIAVGLWDSACIMPAFSIGRIDGAYVLCDEEGPRGTFATVEAALKHGMTMWEGYRHG